MARGRHVRRTGLLSRLRLRRRRPRLEQEVADLRRLNVAAADAATAAVLRAVAAADEVADASATAAAACAAAASAEARALRAEASLAQAREELAALRAELTALREELVWAFAARRAEPVTVIDLRDQAATTA